MMVMMQVVPMLYLHFTLDPMLDISWATRAAAMTCGSSSGTAIYGMLQPYLTPDGSGTFTWDGNEDIYPRHEHWCAAAANLYAQGVDGLYSYLARWPHEESTFRMLRDVHPARQGALRLADKSYRIDEYRLL